MKRLWVVSILTGLALASGMVTTAPLAAAHGVTAIASPSQIEYVGRYTGPATCRVLRVHLNGTQPNTGICLDNQEPLTQGAAPLLSNRNPCNLLDSHIFQDYGEQGALICFYGSGTVNLSDWRINPFVNWNNEASSYIGGGSSGRNGTFYSFPNEGGTQQPWDDTHYGNFGCGTNHVCNDDLSSIRIN